MDAGRRLEDVVREYLVAETTKIKASPRRTQLIMDRVRSVAPPDRSHGVRRSLAMTFALAIFIGLVAVTFAGLRHQHTGTVNASHPAPKPSTVGPPSGILKVIAGDPALSFVDFQNGGAATTTALGDPAAIAADQAGNVFIADNRPAGLPAGIACQIREVLRRDGTVIAVAGNGHTGYSGDGGLAVHAPLRSCAGLAVDRNGDVFVSDIYDGVVREVHANSGTITTVAGGGSEELADGVPAIRVRFLTPTGLAVDSEGGLYVADRDANRVMQISPDGLVHNVGLPGLSKPTGISVNGGGDLFIADTGNNRVREVVKRTGLMITVAGTGVPGYSRNGSVAVTATLSNPQAVAVDSSGNLFVAEGDLREVIRSSGTIWTILGLESEPSVSGAIASGSVSNPARIFAEQLAWAPDGSLLVADSVHRVVAEIDFAR